MVHVDRLRKLSTGLSSAMLTGDSIFNPKPSSLIEITGTRPGSIQDLHHTWKILRLSDSDIVVHQMAGASTLATLPSTAGSGRPKSNSAIAPQYKAQFPLSFDSLITWWTLPPWFYNLLGGFQRWWPWVIAQAFPCFKSLFQPYFNQRQLKTSPESAHNRDNRIDTCLLEHNWSIL